MSVYEDYVQDFLNSEVFVVSTGEFRSSLYMFSDYDYLCTFINNISVVEGKNTQIHHGILCRADILPLNFNRQKPYIIMFDDDSEGISGVVIDAAVNNMSDLATEIENAAMYNSVDARMQITSNENISNIFILYGYQINIKLAVDMEDLDEESIDSSKGVCDGIEQIRKGLSV